MYYTKEETEKAVLVGVALQSKGVTYDQMCEYLDELSFLAETAGAETVKIFTQNLDKPVHATFVGKGKLEEIQAYAEENAVDMIIFDDELTPTQLRNIEGMFKGIKVLDRTNLILDIFASRARTAHAKTQVELAQYQYLLPRLTGMWTHLERQEGAIGTRGPGETQLETDRRHIRKKISKLKEDLEEVRRVRAVQRERREKNQVPVVALVGYTNAGKSTLLNTLTGENIPANNRLFDTLDTTTRTLELSDTCTALLSDTVGFIRKLPTHLVAAFKATLEELTFADLLLHVIDASNPAWMEQAEVVEGLILSLGAAETPRLEVFNKCDLCPGEILPHGEDRVAVSARTGEGLDKLRDQMAQRLDAGRKKVNLSIPYDQGGVLDQLYREAQVDSVEYGETIEVTAVCTPITLGKLKEFITGGWTPPKEPWED